MTAQVACPLAWVTAGSLSRHRRGNQVIEGSSREGRAAERRAGQRPPADGRCPRQLVPCSSGSGDPSSGRSLLRFLGPPYNFQGRTGCRMPINSVAEASPPRRGLPTARRRGRSAFPNQVSAPGKSQTVGHHSSLEAHSHNDRKSFPVAIVANHTAPRGIAPRGFGGAVYAEEFRGCFACV